MSQKRHKQAVPSYPEAVAQWRLDLRTEVKRASALPSSVFSACDPMIESLLAETAESMLALLQEPSPQAAFTPPEGEDKRLETVTGDELRALPARIAAGGPTDVHLDAGLTGEYLAVLTDACGSGHETAARGASILLHRDFGIRGNDGCLDETAALQELLDKVIGGNGDAAQLAEICQRLSAAVIAHQAPADEHGDDEGGGDDRGATE